MKKMNNKGFTLAELLIVVAIIAVLVAIAIPVFTTQLERSRETTDVANLRAAYAAGVTYAMNNKISGTSSLYYAPNKDDSISAGSGAKLGQGTPTDGKADLSSINGGAITYTNTTDARKQDIVVTFNSGTVQSVAFRSGN